MAQKKKLQVFVSSTYADLRDERQAAVEAILAAGHIPAGMELFAAGDQSQMEVIKRWIDESGVFLLILGGRYGSIDPDAKKSYIQLEYEYAREKAKPFLAAVIDEDFSKERVKTRGIEVYETTYSQQLKEFRATVSTKLVKFWRDPRDIKLAVMETLLTDFARRDELVGWIPGDQAVNTGALAEEIARLGKENASLKERMKPRLEISNGVPVNNRNNRVFPIKVKSVSSSDVEECSVRLTRIVHNGTPQFDERNAYLTFQPSEQDDATSKTIRPDTSEYCDVIFLEFNGETTIVLPGTKNRAWIFYPTFQQIFSERGDYFLTIQVTAKDMAHTITRELQFHYDDKLSTLELMPP